MAAIKQNFPRHDKKYIGSLLNKLYIDSLNENTFTDIILSFRDKEVRAHRVILAASSVVFAAMLQTNMKEKYEGKINMSSSGLHPEFVDDFLLFIYTGKLCLTDDNVESFICCGNFLMIECLTIACCEFLRSKLSSTNCLAIANISSRFRYDELNEVASKMIFENFSSVVQGSEFLHLGFQDMFDLLSNDKIEITSEDVVFNAFIKWMEFDMENRSVYFRQLLECVRIQFLSDAYFAALNFQQDDQLIEEAKIARAKYNDTGGMELVKVGGNIAPRRCLDMSIVIMTTGGYDGNNCLISTFTYSMINQKWGHLAPMKLSRHDHGTVSLRNKMFVVGGFNCHKGPICSAEYYNPVRNEWVEMCAMNAKRKSVGVCIFQNKVFVSGGLDGNYNSLSSVEFYNDVTDTWTNFTPMNEARYSHGFVSNSDCMFAIGGWKLATLECYNGSSWRMLSPMSVHRAGATSLLYNNKIYMFGGYSQSKCVSTLEIYDIVLDIWTHGSSSNIPRWRSGSALVDKKLFIIGGRDSSWKYLDEVESYNLETDSWSLEYPLPCKIMGLRCSILKVPKHSIRFQHS